MARTSYPPIADYGFIADGHSAALVSKAGSIDWYCLPRFDSRSCFGRLLGREQGGYCRIAPSAAYGTSRRYVGDSLVLETTFETRAGTVRLVDCLTMREGGGRDPYHPILRILDGIEGAVPMTVEILPRFDFGAIPHQEVKSLEGYRRSKPVRIGNAADRQLQLDVFGVIMDLAWEWHARGHSPDDDYWEFLEAVLSRTCDEWNERDHGIWEIPGRPRHFVQSKVMRWVIPYDDKCMIRTTDAIRRELGKRGFLYRYPRGDDGLKGREGVFLACSFWLVRCLAHQGRQKEARAVFERALSAGNDLLLFSEQFDPDRGEMLGNFPQGLTHLSLITAAVAIMRTT